MTISSLANEVAYTGDGVTVSFAVTFPFDTAADLKVFVTDLVTGAITPLSVGFTVVATNVVFSVAPSATTRVTVLDDPALTQPTDYTNLDAFPAESHEGALDRVTRVCKRLHQQWTRTLRFPDGDLITDGTVSSTVNRRGKYLFFNAITGALEYATSVIGQTLSQSIIAQFLNPQTATEISVGAVPVNFQYPVTPFVDPRRYGASTASADNHTALQTALNVAYAGKGALLLPEMYITSPLSLTMTGSASQPLRIFGSSVIGCGLQAKAGLTNTTLLTFKATDINVGDEAYLSLEHFSIVSTAGTGGSSGVHGLLLQGLANVTLENVRITQFDRGLDIESSLNVTAHNRCGFIQCSTGVYVRFTNGAAFTTNRIELQDCIISLNTILGVDYSGGTMLSLIHNDIEGNGAAGILSTGGVSIGGTCGPVALEGAVILSKNWFELNKGYQFNANAQVNGCAMVYTLEDNQFISSESDRALIIRGAWSTYLKCHLSAVNGTYDITSTYGTFVNVHPNALTVSGVTYPTVISCTTGGVANSVTGVQTQNTLTNVGLSGTCLVNIYQQGVEITLIFTDTETGSSSTSFSMTGLDAKFRPISTWVLPVLCYDNSLPVDGCSVTLTNGSGTLTFAKAGTVAGWTNAGNKGIRRCAVRYRLDI